MQNMGTVQYNSNLFLIFIIKIFILQQTKSCVFFTKHTKNELNFLNAIHNKLSVAIKCFYLKIHNNYCNYEEVRNKHCFVERNLNDAILSRSDSVNY